MRRVLSALTGISLLLASSASFGQQSANSNVAEFNGANVAQKFPPPVEAADGMAVSSQRDASKAGAEILAAGGNAVDAAVAIGYALAVVHPCCGNIGGGGFATIHLANGKDTFINFREKAPAAASANMYLDADGNVIPGLSIHGYKAVGVPGTVMGMEKMLKEYGTMTRAQVMAPAIKLADEGYVLQDGDARGYANAAKAFAAQPNVAAIFLNNGQQWKAGERLVQKQLGRHLEGNFGARPGRLLQGRYRQPRGGSVQGQWRPSHHEGFRRLYRHGKRAAHLRLSRLSHHFLAAAFVGRRLDVRDPQHPVRLSDGQDAGPFRQERAFDGGSDAPRLCGPQFLAGRSGLREKSRRLSVVRQACGRHPRPYRPGQGDAFDPK